MRILHTSDWHLGRQFHGVSLLEDQRHILGQVIAAIREHAVDVLVIAGDIYDRAVPPTEAIALLDDFIHEVVDGCGVPVILIAGNHDGPVRLALAARQLARARVHVAGPLMASPEPVVLHDAHGPVAFYAIPYADPPEVRDLLREEIPGHPEAMYALTNRAREHNDAGRRAVLIAHCFVDGYTGSESERPLSVGGVATVPADCFDGFHYVALGHLHEPQSRGAPHVRYSGSPLPYAFSEKSDKSLTLVDMDADGACSVSTIALVPRRQFRTVSGTLDEILRAAAEDPRRDDYILVSLQQTDAILDLMEKLRAVYPNTLRVQRPDWMASDTRTTPTADPLKRGEMAMFGDFFRDMTGIDMDERQSGVIADIVTALHRGGAV